MFRKYAYAAIVSLITLLAIGAAVNPATSPTDLLQHGDFSQPSTTLQFWKASPSITIANVEGHQYFRFPAGAHRDLTIVQSTKVPPGVHALRIAVSYRCERARPDFPAAQFSLRFFDPVQVDFEPPPSPIVLPAIADAPGRASATVPVPDGATSMNIVLTVPAESSADFDLASMSLLPDDANSLAPYSPAPSVGGVAIRREADHTIFGDGSPTVWFIHPYVDVVGHDFADGIRQIIRESQKRGHPVAIGCSMHLDPALLADQSDMTYVFSYKNIDYPLPTDAHELIFLNTWLRPNVQWPQHAFEHKIAYLGSRTLGNDGDGKATDKARWNQIAKEDPALSLHVLDNVGYYLPLKRWTTLVLDSIAPAATQP